MENIEKLREIEFLQREERLRFATFQKLNKIENEDKRSLHVVYVMTWTAVCGGSKIILEHANRLNKIGYKITIVSHFHKPDWFPLNKEINFINVPWGSVLCEAIPECDVIVATYWREIYECIEQKIAPVVYFEQGDFHLFDTEKVTERVGKYISKQYNVVPFILTVSTFAKNTINKVYGRKDATVITNAVDDKIFYKNDFINQKEHDLEISFIGDEKVKFKNIHLILEALDKVKALGYKFNVNWITPTEPEKLFKGVIINPKQQLIGDTLRKTDIFICASEYESFCLPVLEAMTCGASVITTNNGGNMDFVRENENAVLIEKNNVDDIITKLILLLENKDFRIKLSNEGLKTAKDFSWENTINKLDKYYREISKHKPEN